MAETESCSWSMDCAGDRSCQGDHGSKVCTGIANCETSNICRSVSFSDSESLAISKDFFSYYESGCDTIVTENTNCKNINDIVSKLKPSFYSDSTLLNPTSIDLECYIKPESQTKVCKDSWKTTA